MWRNLPASGDGRGNDDAGRVDGLPDALQVDAPCDFFDENRCQTLISELLVRAEEIDLRSFKGARRRQRVSTRSLECRDDGEIEIASSKTNMIASACPSSSNA